MVPVRPSRISRSTGISASGAGLVSRQRIGAYAEYPGADGHTRAHPGGPTAGGGQPHASRGRPYPAVNERPRDAMPVS